MILQRKKIKQNSDPDSSRDSNDDDDDDDEDRNHFCAYAWPTGIRTNSNTISNMKRN